MKNLILFLTLFLLSINVLAEQSILVDFENLNSGQYINGPLPDYPGVSIGPGYTIECPPPNSTFSCPFFNNPGGAMVLRHDYTIGKLIIEADETVQATRVSLGVSSREIIDVIAYGTNDAMIGYQSIQANEFNMTQVEFSNIGGTTIRRIEVIGPLFRNWAIDDISIVGDFSQDEEIDLALNLLVGQVHLFDPNLDFVAGKSADLIIDPSINKDNDNIPDETEVSLVVTKNDQELPVELPVEVLNSSWGKLTVGILRDKEKYLKKNIFVDNIQSNNPATDEIKMTLKVDSDEVIDKVSENNEITQNITYVFTNNLKIGFAKIENCQFGEKNEQCYWDVDRKYMNFLRGTPQEITRDLFPVRDDGVEFSLWPTIPGNNNKEKSDPNSFLSRGVLEDMNTLGFLKNRNKDYMNRIVGLVSQDYMRYHDLNDKDINGNTILTLGIANLGIDNNLKHPAVLVTDNRSEDTLAHELAHSFGLNHSTTIPETTSYDAIYSQQLNGQNSIINSNFLLPDATLGTSYVWIEMAHYNYLFSEFRKPFIDPEILIIAGFVNKDGSVEIDRVLINEDGNLTPNPNSGNIEINLYDNSDNIIDNFKFALSFKMDLHPGEIRDVNEQAFIVAMPYEPDMGEIEVTVDGISKTKVNILSYSLVSTVESIDYYSQLSSVNIISAKNRKEVLLNEAHMIENLISRGANINAIINKLNNLEEKIMLWMNTTDNTLVDKEFVLCSILRLRNSL